MGKPWDQGFLDGGMCSLFRRFIKTACTSLTVPQARKLGWLAALRALQGRNHGVPWLSVYLEALGENLLPAHSGRWWNPFAGAVV